MKVKDKIDLIRSTSLPKRINAEYHTRPALHPIALEMMVKNIIKILKKQIKKTPFDAIAIRGMSGAVVGSVVANKMLLPLIIVRKNESRHGVKTVEGDYTAKRYIIIDDLIETGSAVNIIIKNMKEWNKSVCVGIVCYFDCRTEHTPTDFGVEWIHYANKIVKPST